MNPLYFAEVQVACYANDNNALIPEMWAHESIDILMANSVMANLVHRDFESAVASFGDVVNTRKPSEFKIRRKKDGTTLTQQDVTATNVPVPLDQWFYESFVIKDGEGSKSFVDLVNLYLKPAVSKIGEAVDRVLLGYIAHSFLGTPAQRVGRLGNLTSTNAYDYAVELDQILNTNKAPAVGRSLVLAPSAKAAMLKTSNFIQASLRGDGGNAMETAELGTILGFKTLMDQNVNSLTTGADISATAITLTEPYSAGEAGALAAASIGTELNLGEFFIVDGNDQPTYATAKVDSTSVTLNEALKYATLDNAVCKRYKKCDVNGAYVLNYSEGIDLDGWTATKAPQQGQLIAFGTGANRRTYTILESELKSSGLQTIWLDRPLEVALANDDLAFPGPYGSFNIGFTRNAVALVSRPLALPASSLGVQAGHANSDNVTMRVLMQYDINAGGTIVNVDLLAGIAKLDAAQGVVLLG